jgi:tRNA threonylcarbamoyladenosine biosynthesis protein TsaE
MSRISLLWRSAREEETIRFGQALGRALAAPAWIGLTGPLGSGKTRLIQGLAAGLGVAGPVKSPTFVLEHRYRGRVPVLHYDLYRCDRSGEDLEASWEEATGSVVLVEWAERVESPPEEAVRIAIAPEGASSRWINLEWMAGRGPLRDLRFEGLRPAPGPEGISRLPAVPGASP